MKRKTIAELQSQIDRLTPYEQAAWLMRNEIGMTERFRYDGALYVYTLYGATRAHGGVLTVETRINGQTPSLSAYWFDDMRHTTQNMVGHSVYGSTVYTAMERLANRRTDELDRKERAS